MQTIANQGRVEEDAIQYIIDGIQDDEPNKSILYSAHNISELRKNLERYDIMCEKTNKRRQRRERGKEIGKSRGKEGKKKD